VSRYHGGAPIRDHYRRVADRRGRNIGRVAAARKLLSPRDPQHLNPAPSQPDTSNLYPLHTGPAAPPWCESKPIEPATVHGRLRAAVRERLAG
jgi:hypothetical protein